MTEEQVKQVSQLIDEKLGNALIGLGDHLAQSLTGIVKVTVNGKIDKIAEEQRRQSIQINDMSQKFDSYVKEDMKWKAAIEPIKIEREEREKIGVWFKNKMNETVSISKSISVIVAAVGMLAGLIWGAFKILVHIAIIK